MNLRIAPEHIRFRITEEEFATLVTHGALSSGTSLGGAANLYYGIRTHPADSNREGQILELTTDANEGVTRFVLTIFANGLAKLQSSQTGKDGVQEHLAFDNGDMLTIGLEIDLHSRKGAN